MKNGVLGFIAAGVLWAGGDVLAKDKGCKTHAPGMDVYKHFTGTIGKKKVTVDLRYGYCGASNYGGSFISYQGSEEPKQLLIRQPHTFEFNTPMQATESGVDESWVLDADRYAAPHPTWEFTMKDDQLTGKWYSANKSEAYEIDLKETYASATPFDIVVHEDSLKRHVANILRFDGTYSFIGVQPSTKLSKEDAEFINKQFAEVMGVPPSTVNNTERLAREEKGRDFINFNKKADDLVPSLVGDTTAKVYSGRYFSNLFPVHNSNGMLVMEHSQYAFAIDTIEKCSTYLTIDVREKKIWHLTDIMTVDKSSFRDLLQAEYVKKLKNGSSKIDATEIGPTEQFIVTDNSLIFCYSFSGDEIRLNIPYNKIKGLLMPEFKKRMNVY